MVSIDCGMQLDRFAVVPSIFDINNLKYFIDKGLGK